MSSHLEDRVADAQVELWSAYNSMLTDGGKELNPDDVTIFNRLGVVMQRRQRERKRKNAQPVL